MRRASWLVAVVLAGCGPTPPQPQQRLFTDDLAIQIFINPSPPIALETIEFRVVVRDKESSEPIDGGEGRIFATNEDRKNVYNGLEPGPEPGTYYARLVFVTAGPWAIGFQFRRDSTSALQRANDWMQDVYTEPPRGKGPGNP